MSALANYRTEPLSAWYDKVKTRYTGKIYELLGRYLPPDARILEVGPGHGHFARRIREAGLEYDAIDSFRQALVEAGFKVSEEPVPPVRRADAAYNLVYASMVIENLPSSYEAGEFAFEAARVLDKEGVLCLIFPNYLTWGRFFFDEHYTHSFETTPRRVKHLLTSQGFEVVCVEHTLGWFWVEGSLVKNIIRHTVNVGMWFVHAPATRWAFEYIGLGELHWKVRKTFFESVVMVARKQ